MDDELPPGWAWATLDELGKWTGGGTPSKAKPEYWKDGTVPWVSPKDMKKDRVGAAAEKITEAAVVNSAANFISAGSILCVIRSGILQHTFPVAIAECDVTINQDMRALTTHPNVDPDFVRLFLLARNQEILYVCSKDGTTVASVEMRRLGAVSVPVAPAAEQRRIVAHVLDLMAEVEAGEAALARARDGVAQFRASLLHAACTGALTAEWREKNPPTETGADLLRRILAERRAAWERSECARLEAKGTPPRGDAWKARYVEPAAPDLTDMPELPEGWAWASVDQVTDFRGNGLSRAPDGNQADPKILRISAVRPMRVDVSQSKNYRPQLGEKLDGGTAEDGDLLFTRYSGSEQYVGVCGLLRSGGPILFPDKVMCARLTDKFRWLANFLEIALNAGKSRQHISSNIRTTAGQKGIAGSAIKCCPVPLPPRSEILEVCRDYDAMSVECELSSDLPDDSVSLRQSILHAAFTGRLVPQSPEDEPASALLARLRAAPPAARRAKRLPRRV